MSLTSPSANLDADAQEVLALDLEIQGCQRPPGHPELIGSDVEHSGQHFPNRFECSRRLDRNRGQSTSFLSIDRRKVL